MVPGVPACSRVNAEDYGPSDWDLASNAAYRRIEPP
jgi:hypothetical protein